MGLKVKSTFEKWQDGEISGFGSFHTALLKAYQLASSDNRKKLDKAFPEWFKTKKQK